MNKWRAERERLTIVSIRREEAQMLTNASPDLLELIAAQERDARTFNIKRPSIFISAAQAERLFYGGVEHNEE